MGALTEGRGFGLRPYTWTWSPCLKLTFWATLGKMTWHHHGIKKREPHPFDFAIPCTSFKQATNVLWKFGVLLVHLITTSALTNLCQEGFSCTTYTSHINIVSRWASRKCIPTAHKYLWKVVIKIVYKPNVGAVSLACTTLTWLCMGTQGCNACLL